jgi:hypothetical protein
MITQIYKVKVIKLTMATINVSESTKNRFKKIKLEESAKKGYIISEDEFVDYLLNQINTDKRR